MEKIDLKDRRILYQLDMNSRQSLSQIGKTVKIPKNVVAYRINKLKERGIIKNFFTIIDAFKLGYLSIRVCITYQYATPEIKQEICEYFVQNKYTYWVASTEGRFDLVVIMWVGDLSIFYTFWKETLKKYRNYFQDQSLSVYIQLLHYRNSYLLDNYDKKDREIYELIGSGIRSDIDEMDFNLLRIIAPNARIPITEIAQELGMSVPTIKYRLRKLIKTGIIQGFRVELDISKLGYKQFKIDIDLKEYNKIEEISNYVVSNPHLYYITRTAGYADLEFSFRVRSIDYLHDIMNDILRKFPHAIKNYKYFYIIEMHKLCYMPEESLVKPKRIK